MRKLIDVLLQLSEKGPKKGFEMTVVYITFLLIGRILNVKLCKKFTDD